MGYGEALEYGYGSYKGEDGGRAPQVLHLFPSVHRMGFQGVINRKASPFLPVAPAASTGGDESPLFDLFPWSSHD